ncbi:MAG TPA: hypothetical protein VMV92_36490 [Streptosporangiaceae bacterium]|nr:hypothetical protein [Streptosporangiaceae bacterium]
MRHRLAAQSRACRTRPRVLAAGLAAAGLAAASTLTGCATASDPVPGCGAPLRLAIIAQSVPGASYVPCIRQLPQGWTTSSFDPARGATSFTLNSDRAPGEPVTVRLAAGCRPGRATPSPPRAPGVATYTWLASISPRVTGRLYDVFPGGCVTYRFDFPLGPHIGLMEEFGSAIGLYSRQQLRRTLKQELGVELDP